MPGTDTRRRNGFKNTLLSFLAMLPSGGTLLDVGCGACQLTTYLAPEFDQVYGVDFSETMLLTARQRIERRGLTNVWVLSGTAQKFPEVINNANVILSYQLVQYLTLQTSANICMSADGSSARVEWSARR